MIGLLNPRKEDKETPIKMTKKRNKMCSVVTLKSGVTWPKIVCTRKIRERKIDKAEGVNLARQDLNDSEDMVVMVMVVVVDKHVDTNI